jgi:hypothetical protein
MSQLVFNANAGGTITITGANVSTGYNYTLPGANGTLLYQDSTNTAQFINANATGTLTVGGASTFAGFTSTSDGIFSGTGQVYLPVGTTAQRSGSPVNGMIRYNSTTGEFEGYASGAWGNIGGGATGGGSDQVFVLNGVTVTTSYTLPSNKNAETVGPITINSGATVTVPSGQRWLVL